MFGSMVRDGQVEQMRESGCVDGSRHGQRRREMESAIRLDVTLRWAL
jgi:hypothetical protein